MMTDEPRPTVKVLLLRLKLNNPENLTTLLVD